MFEAACKDGGQRPTGGGAEEPGPAAHLFFGAWLVRGGVTGRPEFTPPYWYLAFFSDGFRIWDKRWNVMKNTQNAHESVLMGYNKERAPLPERNTWGTRPHSSCRQHCQTPRSSSAQRTASPAVVWQRTHSRLQQPVAGLEQNTTVKLLKSTFVKLFH